MPTARRSRRIAAPAQELWAVVSDPHHLPRWWPRVERVEDVHEGAFTEVMKTKKGKTVRADFDRLTVDPGALTVSWEQVLQGTPFAGVLAFSETEIQLVGEGLEAVTEVTIELRQEMSGARGAQAASVERRASGRPGMYRLANRSWGGRMVRKAATATLEEALDGLERISA